MKHHNQSMLRSMFRNINPSENYKRFHDFLAAELAGKDIIDVDYANSVIGIMRQELPEKYHDEFIARHRDYAIYITNSQGSGTAIGEQLNKMFQKMVSPRAPEVVVAPPREVTFVEEVVIPPDEAVVNSPFQEMTVKELKAYAEENGIDLLGATRKNDIIDAIQLELQIRG